MVNKEFHRPINVKRTCYCGFCRKTNWKILIVSCCLGNLPDVSFNVKDVHDSVTVS